MKMQWLSLRSVVAAGLGSVTALSLVGGSLVGGALVTGPPSELSYAQEPDPSTEPAPETPAPETPAPETPAPETTEQEETPAPEKQEEAKQEEDKPAESETPATEEPAEGAPESAEGGAAQETAPVAGPDAVMEGVSTEVAITGLYNPCGIAIQPETNTVFISDSGNRRVVRWVDGKLEEVIVEFPEDIYGKGPKYTIGPLGLAFLDKDTLVVGGGGFPDGEELLRVFKVPAAGEPAKKADQMENSMALAAEGEIPGEGNFYALAVTDTGVYATLNGDDTKGWVGKATREGNTLKDFTRYIATKEAVQVDAPVGICTYKPGVLVVGQMGEITEPGDSLLTFYKEEDGKEVGNFKTGLSDITAVGYSSIGHLYALDFSWYDTTKGGLFRLVAKDKTECESKPVVMLDKPTAMVFDDEGNLWVTVIGSAEEGAENKGGQVIKVLGLTKE